MDLLILEIMLEAMKPRKLKQIALNFVDKRLIAKAGDSTGKLISAWLEHAI